MSPREDRMTLRVISYGEAGAAARDRLGTFVFGYCLALLAAALGGVVEALAVGVIFWLVLVGVTFVGRSR